MKKSIIKISILISLIAILDSCAFHHGMMQGSAILSSNNFVYIKRDVSGSSAAHYFLGLGGLSKDELVAEAKKDLITKNKIQGNQTLLNISVGWKQTMVFPLILSNRCIVTADIIEYK